MLLIFNYTMYSIFMYFKANKWVTFFQNYYPQQWCMQKIIRRRKKCKKKRFWPYNCRWTKHLLQKNQSLNISHCTIKLRFHTALGHRIEQYAWYACSALKYLISSLCNLNFNRLIANQGLKGRFEKTAFPRTTI